jgi:hypothetical protein
MQKYEILLEKERQNIWKHLNKGLKLWHGHKGILTTQYHLGRGHEPFYHSGDFAKERTFFLAFSTFGMPSVRSRIRPRSCASLGNVTLKQLQRDSSKKGKKCYRLVRAHFRFHSAERFLHRRDIQNIQPDRIRLEVGPRKDVELELVAGGQEPEVLPDRAGKYRQIGALVFGLENGGESVFAGVVEIDLG